MWLINSRQVDAVRCVNESRLKLLPFKHYTGKPCKNEVSGALVRYQTGWFTQRMMLANQLSHTRSVHGVTAPLTHSRRKTSVNQVHAKTTLTLSVSQSAFHSAFGLERSLRRATFTADLELARRGSSLKWAEPTSLRQSSSIVSAGQKSNQTRNQSISVCHMSGRVVLFKTFCGQTCNCRVTGYGEM